LTSHFNLQRLLTVETLSISIPTINKELPVQRWITSGVLSLSLLAPAFGQTASPAPRKAPAAAAPKAKPAPVDPRLKSSMEKLDLKEGDSIVFLGDSITHQCLYTQYLEDFFYTRFPTVHVHFHNSGVGRDRASDALARFDMDVAAYKPKYVTILLGMNDGGYKQWNAETFETYQKDMLALLDKINGIGATAIVMGPTMFDRDALLIKPNPKRPFDSEVSKYYNAVLAYYGTFMRDAAIERGLPYVDMFAPLNELSEHQRLQDPNFTMIPDAVHPDPNGQTVMATAVLQALNTPHAVAATNARLDAKQGWKVTIGPGGKATDVEGDADHLSFTSLEPCLPWVLPADAAVGYKISIAGHHYSNEALQVQGLAPGKYELKIDGQAVGTFPSSVLAFRIELQNFDKAPQYQQALEVATLNKEKNEKATHPIRDLYGKLKGVRRNAKTTPETLAAYIEEMKPKVAEFEKLEAQYDQKIYEAAQPKPHKYEITRVSGN
jgi:lysophospholipase L1-like esterase